MVPDVVGLPVGLVHVETRAERPVARRTHDRGDARISEVVEETYELFMDLLDESHSQDALDFPVVYASAKTGVAKYALEDANTDLTPLFETILLKIPPPPAEENTAVVKARRFMKDNISRSLSLDDLGALEHLDFVAARDFVLSMQLSDGGFRGGEWDDGTDVEYTFYGLGGLALLAKMR